MNLGKESEYVEFKESLSELEAGLKSLSSMLNRHQKGTLYIGVKDNGDIVGIEIAKDLKNKLKEKIKVKIKPMVVPDIEIKKDENKKYIEINVEGSNIPYSYDGRYFIRNSASDEQVDNYLLKRMCRSDGTDVISEKKSYNQELTFEYFIAELKKQDIHINSIEQICKSYHLYTVDGFYNDTAYLLSDQNDYVIKAIKFDGVDKAYMHDKKDFTNQSILKSLPEMITYVNIYNTRKVDLRFSPRKEIPLFDENVFKEAITNAFVHNDWSMHLPPAVYLYEDRLEIVSYGTLPYLLSLDDFYAGKSMPVNDALFRIFLITKQTEQSGHGVPIIVKAYGKDVYDMSSGMIVTTLKYNFNIKQDNKTDGMTEINGGMTEIKGGMTEINGGMTEKTVGMTEKTDGMTEINDGMTEKTDSMTDKKEIVMEILKKNGHITNSIVRTKMQISAATAKRLLHNMVAKGILKVEGETKGRKYYLNQRTSKK